MKLKEDTIVEVGKYYTVPCAMMENKYDVGFLIPVIGHPHKDLQFNVPVTHYHIDGRFANHSGRFPQVDREGRTNGIIAISGPGGYSYNGGFRFMGIIHKRLKCKRLTTGIRPPKLSQWNKAGLYNTWYNSMIGKSCAGKRCPHLGTLMHEHNGILVCPLHDLQGDRTTEKIIERHEILNNKTNKI